MNESDRRSYAERLLGPPREQVRSHRARDAEHSDVTRLLDRLRFARETYHREVGDTEILDLLAADLIEELTVDPSSKSTRPADDAEGTSLLDLLGAFWGLLSLSIFSRFEYRRVVLGVGLIFLVTVLLFAPRLERTPWTLFAVAVMLGIALLHIVAVALDLFRKQRR